MQAQHTSRVQLNVLIVDVGAVMEAAANSFPLVIPCVLFLVCSCLCTSLVYLTSQQKNSQGIGFLAFVLSLMLGTLLAPRRIEQPPILLFCMHICCFAYVWATSSVVVSFFLI